MALPIVTEKDFEREVIRSTIPVLVEFFARSSAACQRQAATVLVEPGPDAGLRSDVASKPLFFAPRADIARLAGRFAIRDVLLVEADGHTWLSPAMQPRVQWLQRPQQVDVLTGFAEAPT